MAVETRPAWANQIEAALCTLRDVESVNVQLEGAEIRELHVLTASQRSPKQIVRDIQTLLLTRFGKSIDHRVVSVAYTRSTREPLLASEVVPLAAAPPPPAAPRRVPVAAPEPAIAVSVADGDRRIRFSSVNLYVSDRAQAQVELRWKASPARGARAAYAARGLFDSWPAATVQLSEFLADDWALGVMGVDFVQLAKKEAAVVGLARFPSAGKNAADAARWSRMCRRQSRSRRSPRSLAWWEVSRRVSRQSMC
jgi:hypothetical protein